MKNKETIEILNDLLVINNDRVEGYEKAVKELDAENAELRVIFSNNAEQSKMFSSILQQTVKELGGDPDTGTTNRGKVYRLWMDIRSTISTDKAVSVLSLCEYGEDAAQKAYEKAMEEDVNMDLPTRRLILDQKSALRDAHDQVKKLRNVMEKVS